MQFRTKLLLLFVPLIVFGFVGVTEFSQLRGERALYSTFQAKALSIAASAASMLNGDLHEKLQSRTDDAGPAYSELRRTLQKIRDANRRTDTQVRFLFTVMPSPQNKSLLVFGVDAEEQEEFRSQLFEVVHIPAFKGIDIRKPHVFDDFVTDQYGTWLSAIHPIRNSAGAVVGAVGVDIDSSQVSVVEAAMMRDSLMVLGIAVSLALILTLWIARKVTAPLERLSHVMARIRDGDYEAQVPVTGEEEFRDAAKSLNQMVKSLRERDRVKSAFARYVSHQVADAVLAGDQTSDAILKGQRRRVTVLFCDIRGFTTISEKLPPEEVVAVLNEYFECLVDVIFRNGGTLDKFLGDGLMAIFGAPVEDLYQEDSALNAAIEMCRAVHTLSERLQRERNIALRIGIGINSGPAIVGNVGSSQRMEYTAIGDTVNLASRLESSTKELGVEILMSEYTRVAVKGSLSPLCKLVGNIQVRGRAQEVTTWTIVDTPTVDAQNDAPPSA